MGEVSGGGSSVFGQAVICAHNSLTLVCLCYGAEQEEEQEGGSE